MKIRYQAIAATLCTPLLLSAGAAGAQNATPSHQGSSGHDSIAVIKSKLDNDRRLEAEYRKQGKNDKADHMHQLALEHEKELGMRPAGTPPKGGEPASVTQQKLDNDRRLEAEYRKKGDLGKVDQMQGLEIEHEKELGKSTKADEQRHIADLQGQLKDDQRLEAEYRKKGDTKKADHMHALAEQHKRELGLTK